MHGCKVIVQSQSLHKRIMPLKSSPNLSGKLFKGSVTIRTANYSSMFGHSESNVLLWLPNHPWRAVVCIAICHYKSMNLTNEAFRERHIIGKPSNPLISLY